ncbi:retrovirus-related pol polyprotein from transposon TNT 1-94, partial [Tanacetum coccineum]
LDSCLAVPTFQQGEDPIECINKAMAFLSAVASRFPPSNNQLRTSSNPKNQTTIQDGRVTVQQVQGRQSQSFAGTGNKGIATTSRGNYAAGQPRVVKCYNCQGEGHMARQCTQPKRPRNVAWFEGEIDVSQSSGSSFSRLKLDALMNSDCDDLSSAKAVQMENLSSCDPQVLFECSVDKNAFEIQIKQLSIDKDQLLKQIMSQEIMHIAVNFVDILDVKKSCVNECNKCLEFKAELLKKKDLIKKDVYDKLLKSYSTLEKHCISLELTTQLNQESQEKDTIIRKLKDMIKSLSGKDSLENVKKDIYEIETINIELEHSVTKLLLENENLRKERAHLKSIYKYQFDSIRKIRVQSKEHCDSLIAQMNAKSVENLDLNAQLQEKVFAITTLKNELRKLKGKNVVDTAVSKPNATIAPGELSVYVSQTCLNSLTPSEKLVAVTPMNKDKRVRFAKLITSSSNISKQTDSFKTKDSNKPLLTSTGVKHTTSASRSKPSGNIKNNRITITSTKVVPTKETSTKSVATPTQGILVYSRRPKAPRSVGSTSKVKIVESKTSNSKEPKQSWGSTVSDVPSYSLNDFRLSKLFCGIWTPDTPSI